jgi:hypothetical protein
VRMQDRAALQDLGTPPSRNSDPNGQIQPRWFELVSFPGNYFFSFIIFYVYHMW